MLTLQNNGIVDFLQIQLVAPLKVDTFDIFRAKDALVRDLQSIELQLVA